MMMFCFSDNDVRKFEIYQTDIETPGFREYHERLQTFVLFFIDGASYIDVDDHRWKFYLLYVTHFTCIYYNIGNRSNG
jgi:histone acetyltransferase 1